MKLDMGQAWNTATAMLSANKAVIPVLAGVFFFLPYLALTILLPETAQTAQPGEDPEAIMAAVTAMYADNWLAFLLVSVMAGIGMLALFALLTDRARPTVGEALKRGAIGLIPYLLAQILAVLAIGVVAGALIAIGSVTGSTGVIALLGTVAAVIGLYAMVKFSLSAAVVGVEGELNPIKVLRRSWQLTKGNSLRIFAFYLLLLVAIVVVMIIVTLVFGLIFAMLGGEIEVIGNAVLGSLSNAVFAVIFYAVIAAVHRQLAGPSGEAVSETFE